MRNRTRHDCLLQLLQSSTVKCATMIKAIIFDFNGVVADDESPHIICFQQALAEAGLHLAKDEYYGTYLGMDERTCARMLLTARDGSCDEQLLLHIVQRKADLFRTHTALHKPVLFPGIVEFVKEAKRRYRIAIASGGRREQIDAALAGTPIEQDFELVVSAEDCPTGKPDPAIYRLTCERLNTDAPGAPRIEPMECLAVEDSLAGIRSSKGAGMYVLALATTYPSDNLREADYVLPNLEASTLADLFLRIDQIGQQRQFSPSKPD